MVTQTPFQFQAPTSPNAAGVVFLGTVALVGAVTTTLDNLVIAGMRNAISDFQSIWVDASLARRTVIVRNRATRQYVVYPPGFVGWLSLILKKDAPQMEITTAVSASIAMAASSSLMPESIYSGGVLLADVDGSRSDIIASAADQLILAANFQRAGFSLWNESTATLYLLLASGVSSAINYSVAVPPGGYFESPYAYGGEVRGIWASATGGARVTEFV